MKKFLKLLMYIDEVHEVIRDDEYYDIICSLSFSLLLDSKQYAIFEEALSKFVYIDKRFDLKLSYDGSGFNYWNCKQEEEHGIMISITKKNKLTKKDKYKLLILIDRWIEEITKLSVLCIENSKK